MRQELGPTVRLASRGRNFGAFPKWRWFSLDLRVICAVVLMGVAGPVLAGDAPDAGQMPIESTSPAWHRAMPPEARSSDEKSRREMNHYRLREWGRIAHVAADRLERLHALSCAQTIGSDVGHWRPQDDLTCELPWLLGDK